MYACMQAPCRDIHRDMQAQNTGKQAQNTGICTQNTGISWHRIQEYAGTEYRRNKQAQNTGIYKHKVLEHGGTEYRNMWA